MTDEEMRALYAWPREPSAAAYSATYGRVTQIQRIKLDRIAEKRRGFEAGKDWAAAAALEKDEAQLYQYFHRQMAMDWEKLNRAPTVD